MLKWRKFSMPLWNIFLYYFFCYLNKVFQRVLRLSELSIFPFSSMSRIVIESTYFDAWKHITTSEVDDEIDQCNQNQALEWFLNFIRLTVLCIQWSEGAFTTTLISYCDIRKGFDFYMLYMYKYISIQILLKLIGYFLL